MSGAAVAVIVARARQRIANHFLAANATDQAHAVAFEPAGRRVERRMFDLMHRFGAIRDGAPGTYWLDEKRFADFRKERLARVLGILALTGFAAAAAMAFGG